MYSYGFSSCWKYYNSCSTKSIWCYMQKSARGKFYPGEVLIIAPTWYHSFYFGWRCFSSPICPLCRPTICCHLLEAPSSESPFRWNSREYQLVNSLSHTTGINAKNQMYVAPWCYKCWDGGLDGLDLRVGWGIVLLIVLIRHCLTPQNMNIIPVDAEVSWSDDDHHLVQKLVSLMHNILVPWTASRLYLGACWCHLQKFQCYTI